MKYKRLLTIAGSDSGGGAGIQADLKTFSACGCYGMSAIVALTVQNTMGVRAIHIPPVEIVIGQTVAVIEDIGVNAVKLGMLPTKEIVEELVKVFKKYEIKNIILDPVMVATSGDELISTEAATSIIERLMPISLLVTPNIPEAEYITGLKIESEDDFPTVAERFREMGINNVLLKAGHLKNREVLTDYLYCGDKLTTYSNDYINTPNTHGTGCTLSAAIAAYVSHGYDLPDAVGKANKYLHKAIVSGADYKTGSGHGPVHHFFKYWK